MIFIQVCEVLVNNNLSLYQLSVHTIYGHDAYLNPWGWTRKINKASGL